MYILAYIIIMIISSVCDFYYYLRLTAVQLSGHLCEIISSHLLVDMFFLRF